MHLTRIGVFYDGNYFTHVSNYYNYVHDRKSRLSLAGIHKFIAERLSILEENEFERCKIVEAHFYKTRNVASEASERGNQLYFDRVFDDILSYEGVTPHYQPIKGAVNSRSNDKSLNLQMALDVVDLAFHDKLDVVVLLASDGDYTPLVNKLNSLGVRVMLICWDFEFTNDDGKRMTTKTAQDLIKSATYPILMHESIEEGLEDDDDTIQSIFVLPPVDQREEREPRESRTFVSTSVENSDAKPGEIHQGEILSLKTGYGFIRFEPNNLFFHHSNLTNADFNDLYEGDEVKFIVEENEKGELVAKEVELMV